MLLVKRNYLTKKNLTDVLLILFFYIIGVFTKKLFHALGTTGKEIHIGSLALNISIYTIGHYLIYIIIVLVIISRIKNITDRIIAEIIKGRARKKFILIKISHFIIYTIAILLLLDILSVDIKIIATIGGTIGLGLGFGLQKITSNFLSGLIIFVEQSVRLYDIIETKDNTTGIVKQLAPRYTLIETSDGKDVFIPNEELVISKVINWTHSNNICRDDFTLLVGHDSDLIVAVNIALKAIAECPNVFKGKNSRCFISGYNEIGIILTMQVWIDDIRENKEKIRNYILSQIIGDFKKNAVQIPNQSF